METNRSGVGLVHRAVAPTSREKLCVVREAILVIRLRTGIRTGSGTGGGSATNTGGSVLANAQNLGVSH